MVFSETLTALLRRAGMTQKQLAEKGGFSRGSVSRWVNGSREPRVSALPRIAEALGVDLDEVLGEKQSGDTKPKGKWVWQLDRRWWQCDQCGEITTDACMGAPRANYCPWCGADMRKED